MSRHANPQSTSVPTGIRKRRSLNALTFVASTLLALAVLLLADLYLHYRHTINLWGYRGPSAGRKQPGERRIAVLGGSTAWGYGLPWEESFPAQLERKIAARRRTDGGVPVRILNLAFNNEGSYSFKYTLRDYDYLNYDLVLLYSGYNDLGNSPNLWVFRDQSPIFRWTGYMPLLPGFFLAKMNALKARVSNEGARTGFVPRPTEEPTAGNKNMTEEVAKSLEQQLGPLSGADKARASPNGCAGEWAFYCQQMYETVSGVLLRGKRVIVATEPYISDRYVEQQRALSDMLKERFGSRADLVYLNLGGTVDLHDRSLCWDGMHLTEKGNEKIAEALVQPVQEMVRQ